MPQKLPVLLSAVFLAVSSAFAGVFYPEGATTLHFAFEGSPNGDRPIVRPPALYAKESGFGFVDSPELVGNANGVQAPQFFRFDADLPEGNYDVSVTVGSPSAPSVTTIRSQEHRPMAVDVRTQARQTARVNFTVNLHKDPINKTEMNSDGRLHLEFIGTNPSMQKLDIKPNTTAATIYIAGDSTACDYNSDPRVGWAEMFALFFKPGEVAVCNMASSGRTAKSFIAEKRQESMFKTMKEGDYLFIQFSHNDMKDTTMTMDAWKTILMTYVDGARERKATPVFVTSIPRRQFDDQNKIKNSLGEFPQTMRDLAKEKQVALIDLNASATVFFNILGPEGTTKAYSHYPADMYTGHLAANADNTHLNPYGAYELAKLVAHEIQSSKLGLASHVVGNLEPQNPDPAKFPSSLNYNPLLIKK